MKRLALVCALALALCPVTIAADTVPFKATIETVFTPPAPCGGPLFCFNIAGSGLGSHFGLMGIDGPSQLNFASFTQTTTSTLTAADGSTLVLALVGTFVPDITGGATFSGTWVTTSGTGRFAGEGGSGTYEGSGTGTGTGTLHIDGRLSNPGKK